MRALVMATYLFLYAPIALVVVFSFNSVRQCTEPEVVVPVLGSMNAWKLPSG